MKSIIRGLISVLFMAVLCVGPGAYGEDNGSECNYNEKCSCEQYAKWVLHNCNVEWGKDGGEGECSPVQTCFVYMPGRECPPNMIDIFMGAPAQCENADGSLTCVDDSYYAWSTEAHHVCRSCEDGYPFHEICNSNDKECGQEYCYKLCSSVHGSNYSGYIYFGKDIQDTCEKTGNDPGGDINPGGYYDHQIAPGCSAMDTMNCSDFLDHIVSVVNNYNNVPELWGNNFEVPYPDEIEERIMQECGFSDKRHDGGETEEWMTEGLWCSAQVCTEHQVQGYLISNWPVAWQCKERYCSEALGNDMWTGIAYGNNCSECEATCPDGEASSGVERTGQTTFYHGERCNVTSTGTCGYKCMKDFYGTATSKSTGCTACPANATCAGGNNSTFVCNGGYYKATANATECSKCPDNATCTTENGIQCHSGYYYKNENGNVTCPACPSHGKCEGGQKSFGCDNPAWYKVNVSATVCTQCPTGAECMDLMPVTCVKGYYQGGSTPPCTVCPGGGTTSEKNADSITDCYVAVNAGTGQTDYTWDEADDDNNVFGSYQCTVNARYVQ